MCNFDKLFYTGITTKCNYVVYQLSSISFNLKYKTIEYIEMRSCTKPYFDNKMKKQWKQNGVLARLQSRIKRDKTLDAVMKEVQIKEEVVDRKEDIDNN